MQFIVAPVGAEDLPRWTQLWNDYQVFYRTQLPEAVTAETWRRLLDGRVQGLLAHTPSSEILGFTHFLYHQDTWSVEAACYLQDLYVDERFRGRGVARGLIEAVAQAARAAGANPPYWLTHETNATARRLYDRVASNAGFIQYVYATS